MCVNLKVFNLWYNIENCRFYLAGGGDGIVSSLKSRKELTQVVYRRIQGR